MSAWPMPPSGTVIKLTRMQLFWQRLRARLPW